jgi:hypothetical protein
MVARRNGMKRIGLLRVIGVRPITITSGTGVVAATDPERMLNVFLQLEIKRWSNWTPRLQGANAALRIVDMLAEKLARRRFLRKGAGVEHQ